MFFSRLAWKARLSVVVLSKLLTAELLIPMNEAQIFKITLES